MAVLTCAMLLVVQGALHPQLGVRPRRMNRLPVMSAADAPGPDPSRVKVQLIAQVTEPRAGVGYSPEQQQQMAEQQAMGDQYGEGQQQYVGVPPPGSDPAGPSLLSRLRGPFIGVTFVASLVLLGIQSNRVYKARQQGLLDSFAATMLDRLGDTREMKAAIRYFRGQLGPGRYSGKMFSTFVVSLSTDRPIGVDAIEQLKVHNALLNLHNEALNLRNDRPIGVTETYLMKTPAYHCTTARRFSLFILCYLHYAQTVLGIMKLTPAKTAALLEEAASSLQAATTTTTGPQQQQQQQQQLRCSRKPHPLCRHGATTTTQ